MFLVIRTQKVLATLIFNSGSERIFVYQFSVTVSNVPWIIQYVMNSFLALTPFYSNVRYVEDSSIL